MSKSTTYKCDRCGVEKEDDGNFVATIGVYIAGTYSSMDSTPAMRVNAEWCRSCITKMGIQRPYQQPGQPPVPGPSLEEIIRDIVREEIQS